MSPIPDLHARVYVSSATALMNPTQLESLLTSARAWNQSVSVTGVLLYGDGNFIQCLEGSRHSIDITFARILASRQHRDIAVLMDEPIAQRSFSEWAMGFFGARSTEILALSSARWEKMSEQAFDAGDRSSGMGLLQEFWARR